MKRILLKFILLTFIILAACCSRGGDGPVIARVGGAVLTQADMERMMAAEGMAANRESDFVDRWVNRELLYQEAKRMGLDRSDDLRLELALVEKEYIIQKLLERHFAERVQITDEEILRYYEENKDLFQVDENEVFTQHILTESRAEANAAHQELMAGRSFEDVARERSTGMFSEEGGIMGYIKADEVIPEVSRVAFRLAEGRISSIIQSRYGYHIVKVVKKKTEGDYKDLVDVQDEILERLRIIKERGLYFDLLYQLQNQSNVFVSVPTQAETDSTVVDEQP